MTAYLRRVIIQRTPTHVHRTPVMEGGHGVEEMRDAGGPVSDGLLARLEVGDGVAQADDDADADELPNGVDGAGKLRR